jgi:hypothetical protein
MDYRRRKQTEQRQDEFTDRPDAEQTRKFEVVMPLLQTMLADLRELAKKKHDAPVNVAKVRRINRLLEDVRLVLAKEPEMAYLEVLEEDELPENADAVMILSQYETAMERFQERHWDDHGWETSSEPI